MYSTLYRQFHIVQHGRGAFVATHDFGRDVEFTGEDLAEVETAIDNWHEGEWRDAVAEVDAAGVQCDEAIAAADRHIAETMAALGRVA